MDATIAGIVGAIIGAFVGSTSTLMSARMQTRALVQQTLGSTHERLYNANHRLLEVLVADPSVRPYFTKPKLKAPSEEDPNYSKIMLVAEMHANHIELASIHLGELPPVVVKQWERFVIDQYECSPVLQQYLKEYKDWYSLAFWKVIGESSSFKAQLLAESSSSQNEIPHPTDDASTSAAKIKS